MDRLRRGAGAAQAAETYPDAAGGVCGERRRGRRRVQLRGARALSVRVSRARRQRAGLQRAERGARSAPASRGHARTHPLRSGGAAALTLAPALSRHRSRRTFKRTLQFNIL